MKVISLYQPYATLMAMGLKTNETRSWDTNYRGQLAIHATANMPKWCKDLVQKEEAFVRNLKGIYLPLGCIVGHVEVVGTMKTEVWEHQNGLNEFILPSQQLQDEWWFGDYSRGRYAWQTINPVQYNPPIPAKGSEGFWNFEIPTVHARTGQMQLFL